MIFLKSITFYAEADKFKLTDNIIENTTDIMVNKWFQNVMLKMFLKFKSVVVFLKIQCIYVN